MSKVIISKFGGTSVADFECMTRCANIIEKTSRSGIAVISATAKTTRQLVALSQIATPTKEKKEVLKSIQDRHYEILHQLGDPQKTKEQLDHLLKNIEQLSTQLTQSINPLLKDELLAHGERISSLLFTEVLNKRNISAIYFDARKVIKTNSKFGSAEPNITKIREHANELLLPLCNDQVVVTQGFIGSDDNNNTTTLGFESSDYTAALLGEALDAKQIKIWTDVPGILTTDPAIDSKSQTINEISFDETNELALFGAKVLHPGTMLPAIRKNIKVFVGSSKNPDQGTWVVNETLNQPVFRSITLRKDQVLLAIRGHHLLRGYDFLSKILDVFATHKINPDLLTTSDINISLVLNKNLITPNLLSDLKRFGDISIEEDLTLITIVGNNLHITPGIGKKIFDTIDQNNIRFISHGASSHNVCFLVEQSDAENLVKKLHENLFKLTADERK